MKPTLGRIVHYSPNGFEKFAAIVTQVYEPDAHAVDLTIFPPPHTASFTVQGIREYTGKGGQGGTWSWPPRV